MAGRKTATKEQSKMDRKGYAEYREALTILEKYAEPNASFVLHAEHDIIFSGIDGDAAMAADDVARLEELGWHISSEADVWACFT